MGGRLRTSQRRREWIAACDAGAAHGICPIPRIDPKQHGSTNTITRQAAR
jgi:hypothetical protein